MRRAILWGATVATLSTSASADDRVYRTFWFFRVDYLASGQYSESTDETATGRVMMPTGSRWQCERRPASVTKTGAVLAGFACYNAAGYVNVVAICAGTGAGEDRASASIGDSASGAVTLTARCKTFYEAPPAPKQEKSL